MTRSAPVRGAGRRGPGPPDAHAAAKTVPVAAARAPGRVGTWVNPGLDTGPRGRSPGMANPRRGGRRSRGTAGRAARGG